MCARAQEMCAVRPLAARPDVVVLPECWTIDGGTAALGALARKCSKTPKPYPVNPKSYPETPKPYP